MTEGYSYISCIEDKIYSACGTSEKFTCEKGNVTNEYEANDYASWKCDCSGSEDCNTSYNYCYWYKPIDAVCSENIVNGCDIGDFDWRDSNTEDFDWVCLGRNGGADASCNINPSTDMYGKLNFESCVIPLGESKCYMPYSWEVFNPEDQYNSEIRLGGVMLYGAGSDSLV